MIKINANVLRRLCAVNNYQIDDNTEIVIIGIRGALPAVPTRQYTPEGSITLTPYNHRAFRCTFVQWLVKENKVGFFVGSTVPGLGNVEDAVEGKTKVNMMLTGYYTDYTKGRHNPRPATAHDALRQTEAHGVRRSKDDCTFEATDPIDYGVQYDNIHAAFTNDANKAPSASHGCQIILGLPKCQKYPKPTPSDWSAFVAKAYEYQQQTIPYILCEGTDFQKYCIADDKGNFAPTNIRLRFGSTGDNVKTLQYKSKCAQTGVFDIATMQGIQKWLRELGKKDFDGVVGKNTAALLNIDLPLI